MTVSIIDFIVTFSTNYFEHIVRFSNAFIIVLSFIIPSVIMQSAFMLSVVALLGKPINV